MTIKIGFVSQLGNTGKSSFATALAIEAGRNGLTSAIADLDSEHRTSIETEEDRRKFGIEPYITVYPVNTVKEALGCFDEEKLQIFDCPSRASKATIQISKEVDLIVQPTSGAKKDMNKALDVFESLYENGIPTEKMIFVLNRVGTEAECRKAIDYLEREEIGGKSISIIQTPIYEKQSYRNALNDGFAITETTVKSLNEVARSVIHQILSSTLK